MTRESPTPPEARREVPPTRVRGEGLRAKERPAVASEDDPGLYLLMQAAQAEATAREAQARLKVIQREVIVVKNIADAGSQRETRSAVLEKTIAKKTALLVLLRQLSREIGEGKTVEAMKYLQGNLEDKAALLRNAENTVAQVPADERENYDLCNALVINTQEVYDAERQKGRPATNLEAALKSLKLARAETRYGQLLGAQEQARTDLRQAQKVLDTLQAKG